MLRLDNVSKRFSEVCALREVSIEFARGETTVLIGSSGSGKSTALRMLNALVRPDAGEVYFEDQPISELHLQSLRRRMGYVIQGGGLFPHLSARDNVCLLARHMGREAGEVDARVETLRTLVKLPQSVLDRRPTELSGGQQQRIALMRALMLAPEVLLLDEPLGALDPLVRAELQQDLKRIFSELGTTVAMVTHDLAEAALFADQVVLLRGGQVVQRGTVRELIGDPRDPFVRRFVEAHKSMLAHLSDAC